MDAGGGGRASAEALLGRREPGRRAVGVRPRSPALGFITLTSAMSVCWGGCGNPDLHWWFVEDAKKDATELGRPFGKPGSPCGPLSGTWQRTQNLPPCSCGHTDRLSGIHGHSVLWNRNSAPARLRGCGDSGVSHRGQASPRQAGAPAGPRSGAWWACGACKHLLGPRGRLHRGCVGSGAGLD